MRIEVQLNESDYLKANYTNIRKNSAMKFIFVLLAICLFGVSYQLYNLVAHGKNIDKSSFFICLYFLALFCFFIVIFRLRIKKNFKEHKLLSIPYTISFTDEAMHSEANYGNSKISWELFLKWQEGETLFLIFQSSMLMHIIPKRFFSSIEDINEFRNLLIKKIGKEK